jgi:two-component system, response regulator PdtaR
MPCPRNVPARGWSKTGRNNTGNASLANMKAKSLVLVVEDETLVRMVATEIAAEADFDVISVANADEAIGVLEGGVDVSVVFTDIHMPGSIDGLGLARSVHERWPPVRLIVTSGRGGVGKDELPEGGRFLLKPYDAGTLIKALREVVG